MNSQSVLLRGDENDDTVLTVLNHSVEEDQLNVSFPADSCTIDEVPSQRDKQFHTSQSCVDVEASLISQAQPEAEERSFGSHITSLASDVAGLESSSYLLNTNMAEVSNSKSNKCSSDPLKQSRELKQSLSTAGSEDSLLPASSIEEVKRTVDGFEEPMYCKICGDVGSGFHYSVYSCEGCKGFFKRSVQKDLRYACKDTGCCIINKYTRNSCQFCRMQRCLKFGMRKESVREDRAPGGKTLGGKHRCKRIRLDDQRLPFPAILHCKTKESEEIVATIEKLMHAEPEQSPPTADYLPEGSAVDALNAAQLMNYCYAELRMIVQWAARVPGFSELVVADQMSLLKNSFMELIILRLAYRSLDAEGLIRFSEGVVLSFMSLSETGWGRELAGGVAECIMRLFELTLDKQQFSLLSAIILTATDMPGLLDRGAVGSLRSHFSECLRRYCSERNVEVLCPHGKILLRLPALRVSAQRALKRFATTALDDSSVRLHTLVEGLV